MTNRKTRRADERHYDAAVDDGRGVANVFIRDGYGRIVSRVFSVVGAHTREEAIAAAKAEFPAEAWRTPEVGR